MFGDDGYPVVVESFRYLLDRMVVEEEQTQTDGYEMSTPLLNMNLWQPRVMGSITFISSVCMLLMAWKRRNLLFHRLVLGLSLNQKVYSLFLIYGAAAIPSDEINAIGNFGTVATCTTQGFFIYVCTFSSHLYYASFSVYSFVGVLHNFEKEKYMWVEKYIHAIVPIYPLITAFVILSKQGFNNNGGGFCSVKNTPLDCNYPNYDDVPCVRGTLLNNGVYFYMVTQKQLQIFIRAKVVAQQAAIYLCALYLALLPTFIISCMAVHLASSQTSNSKEFIFGTEKITAENITAPVMVTSASAPTPVPRTSNNNVFYKMSTKAIRRRQRMRRRNEAEQPKYSFNIFDGTNASGVFADFIHDGDSDDEKVDNATTDHWAAVQDHI
ncbi:hypothetical protein FRACYDRAFT_250091 [Fragilariopsis cylindrus CCMP1102]|uniref:Uncharacterized protein n=1 Tax=Fragilariopsis cylindrus CCMP1102 TaxID=635003 RepID=A0A1E7EQU1_9STRA|nr:hypothetical protein FRACYDRAFT_250091 [Fragilariopsis cylindrus CCMP1102]|eukprot:OEU08302.1 hypothetical protein FRACYDRAFT_250091 [Fragilariopsis cylindrus CCMP1102]